MMCHVAIAIFLMVSGTTNNDLNHPNHTSPDPTTQNLIIAAILNIAIINFAMTIVIHRRNFQDNQHLQGYLQRVAQSSKLAFFVIPIVAPATSSAITTLLQWRISGPFRVPETKKLNPSLINFKDCY